MLYFKNPDSQPESKLSGEKLKDLPVYLEFASSFSVVAIEDPFDQDDWETYTSLLKPTARLSGMICL